MDKEYEKSLKGATNGEKVLENFRIFVDRKYTKQPGKSKNWNKDTKIL